MDWITDKILDTLKKNAANMQLILKFFSDKKPYLLCLLLIMTTPTFATESPEQKFWNWFISYKTELEAIESSFDPRLEPLSKHLRLYHVDIVYEISLHNSKPRELIISGDGLKEMIPIVQNLIQAAPEIEGWKFIAFRPRKSDYMDFKLDFGGMVIDPKRMWFFPITKDGYFDMIIYHPDYSEQDKNSFIGGTYIILDMVLGEFDVMTKVRYMDFQALPEKKIQTKLLPLSELQRVFDKFHNQQN